MHEAIACKRKEIEEVCRRYNVIRLELFGSAARVNDDFDLDASDADFLVKFGPYDENGALHQLFGFTHDMEVALDRDVDVLESDLGDLSDIRNDILRASINTARELVYETDPSPESAYAP